MDYRISKLREYLFSIVDTLTTDTKYQINANMLSNDINNYSLDKIPTASTVQKWITGLEIHRDVFSFRSRMAYSQDTINNFSCKIPCSILISKILLHYVSILIKINYFITC